MSFHTVGYLRKATSRAKSDVANKLVGMFLHDVSRKICARVGLSVSDQRYADQVEAQFGANCCYCGSALEADRAAVEHLDGMNRFRSGLHVPGNVLVSCKRCNNEKRRDDQLLRLTLANSGWESFLSHDSVRCRSECQTCAYWAQVWPDVSERAERLRYTRGRLITFRSAYAESVGLSAAILPALHAELNSIYRECQDFATKRISGAVENVVSSLPPR